MKGHHQEPIWFTIAEISDLYTVHRNTVRAWIKDGRLRAHKLGRVVRIRADDLDRFEQTEMSPVSIPGHRLKRTTSRSGKPPLSGARRN